MLDPKFITKLDQSKTNMNKYMYSSTDINSVEGYDAIKAMPIFLKNICQNKISSELTQNLFKIISYIIYLLKDIAVPLINFIHSIYSFIFHLLDFIDVCLQS